MAGGVLFAGVLAHQCRSGPHGGPGIYAFDGTNWVKQTFSTRPELNNRPVTSMQLGVGGDPDRLQLRGNPPLPVAYRWRYTSDPEPLGNQTGPWLQFALPWSLISGPSQNGKLVLLPVLRLAHGRRRLPHRGGHPVDVDRVDRPTPGTERGSAGPTGAGRGLLRAGPRRQLLQRHVPAPPAPPARASARSTPVWSPLRSTTRQRRSSSGVAPRSCSASSGSWAAKLLIHASVRPNQFAMVLAHASAGRAGPPTGDRARPNGGHRCGRNDALADRAPRPRGPRKPAPAPVPGRDGRRGHASAASTS